MKSLWLLMLLFTACSSANRDGAYRKNANDDLVEVKENDKAIELLNFDKKSEVKYKSDKDEYSQGKNPFSITSRESLQGIPSMKLEEIISKNDDALSSIVSSCHQKKFDEGLKVADDVYGQYKNNPSYWNQLGSCYLLKGDYSKANLFYNKSRELSPNYAPPINNLGVLYYRLGKFQKALATFKKASDLSTFSVTPAFNLAQLYVKFKTTSKAFPILQSLQKRFPDDLDVSNTLATAYVINGQNNDAFNIYRKFDSSTVSKANVGLNYVVALKLTNQEKEAQKVFAKIQKPTENDLTNYYQKVETLLRN